MATIRSARKAREPTDAEVNAVIDLYPDGAPVQAIADVLGVKRSRADQIVAIALGKALATAKARGLIAANFFD